MSSLFTKNGCLGALGILFLIGATVNVCTNISIELKDFHGEWVHSTTNYNPFSLGGVISKGDYPVNYILKIDSDNSYSLYFGSPGFEKLDRRGEIKKNVWEGVIITNYNPGSEENPDWIITGISRTSGQVQSFEIVSKNDREGSSYKYVKK